MKFSTTEIAILIFFLSIFIFALSSRYLNIICKKEKREIESQIQRHLVEKTNFSTRPVDKELLERIKQIGEIKDNQ